MPNMASIGLPPAPAEIQAPQVSTSSTHVSGTTRAQSSCAIHGLPPASTLLPEGGLNTRNSPSFVIEIHRQHGKGSKSTGFAPSFRVTVTFPAPDPILDADGELIISPFNFLALGRVSPSSFRFLGGLDSASGSSADCERGSSLFRS